MIGLTSRVYGYVGYISFSQLSPTRFPSYVYIQNQFALRFRTPVGDYFYRNAAEFSVNGSALIGHIHLNESSSTVRVVWIFWMFECLKAFEGLKVWMLEGWKLWISDVSEVWALHSIILSRPIS